MGLMPVNFGRVRERVSRRLRVPLTPANRARARHAIFATRVLAVAIAASLVAVGVPTSATPTQAAPVSRHIGATYVPEPGAQGHVERDPLQVALEADLQSFITQDYDKMVNDGCADALTSYFDAAHYDNLLERVFDNLQDIDFAMTQSDYVTAALISARIAQAASELVLFAAGAPTAITALGKVLENLKDLVRPNTNSVEAFKNVKAAIDLAIAAAKDISQYKSLGVTYPTKGLTRADIFSGMLNLVGSIKALLSFFKPGGLLGQAEKVLGSAEVGVVRRFLSTAKTVYDIISDVNQWRKDHGSLVDAFVAGWFQYASLLKALQAGVQRMRSAVGACKAVPLTGPGQSLLADLPNRAVAG